MVIKWVKPTLDDSCKWESSYERPILTLSSHARFLQVITFIIARFLQVVTFIIRTCSLYQAIMNLIFTLYSFIREVGIFGFLDNQDFQFPRPHTLAYYSTKHNCNFVAYIHLFTMLEEIKRWWFSLKTIN